MVETNGEPMATPSNFYEKFYRKWNMAFSLQALVDQNLKQIGY